MKQREFIKTAGAVAAGPAAAPELMLGREFLPSPPLPGRKPNIMGPAPFEEKLVAADSKNPEAAAARRRLQAALDKLNPAGGILDKGDGTGRHTGRAKKKKDDL